MSELNGSQIPNNSQNLLQESTQSSVTDSQTNTQSSVTDSQTNTLSSVTNESQTNTESEYEELTQESIIALAKHNESHSEALKETVNINLEIATINQSIVKIRKRIVTNQNRMNALKLANKTLFE
jgi:hypothetical protein